MTTLQTYALAKIVGALFFASILIAIGFYAGTHYAKTTNLVSQSPSPITETREEDTIPTNRTLISAKTGVFKGYLTQKEFPPSMSPLPEICDVFIVTEGDVSMFYTYSGPEDSDWTPRTSQDLPYELIVDFDQLPQNTQNVLRTSTQSSPVYAAITDYVFIGGRDRVTCEPSIDRLIAFTAD